MTITKDTLTNKLLLFCTAGYPASTGWDTAIPQSMFDALTQMGIEYPGAYFVMDCKSQPWALHHTGEALFQILNHRAKANEEILDHLLTSALAEVKVNNDELIFNWLRDSHPVVDEAQAGMVDLNFVVTAWNNGYHEGRKSLVNEIRDRLAGRDDVPESVRAILYDALGI